MAPTLISRSKTLINNDLKRICKEEGLSQTGVKAVLQNRVIDRTLHTSSPPQIATRSRRQTCQIAGSANVFCSHQRGHPVQ